MNLQYSSKDPSEDIVVSQNFVLLLDTGETIASCVFTILDSFPHLIDVSSSMLVGGADISEAPLVKQQVVGGVQGHNYIVRATVVTSNGRTLIGAAQLPVRLAN